jgi:hypothetical protein
MKISPRNYILSSIVTIAPVSTVFYAFKVMNGIPLADEWRWFKNLLLPYIDRQIGIWAYVSGEYSFLGHTHFVSLLALLADYKQFSLNLLYLAYFGTAFYVLGWVLLLVFFLRNHPDRSRYEFFCLILITVAYFCITTDFPWLLVVFEYFYYFWALALLVLVDTFLRQRVSFAWLCVATFFGGLFLDSFGAVAVLTSILILFIDNGMAKKKFLQPLLLAGIYASTLVLLKVIMGDGRIPPSSSRLDALIVLLRQPEDILVSLLISFSQPLLDKAVLQHFFPSSYRLLQMFLGAGGMSIVLISLFGYGRNFDCKKSRLPFLLAGFASIAWVMILLTRYSVFGTYIPDAQRFTRFFVLYYVAAAFAFLEWRPRGKVWFSTFATVSVSAYLISAGYQYGNIACVHRYFEGASVALREEHLKEDDLKKYIGQCADGYCEGTIYALRAKGIPFVQVRR